MRQILLIEDSEADQYIFQYFMKKKKPDVEIIITNDGEHALEVLKKMEAEPDLIFLDINMPVMNGHEFLKEFTEDNSREIPVVIMLTSSDQEQDKAQAMSFKCVKEYLVKPLKAEHIEMLDSFFEN